MILESPQGFNPLGNKFVLLSKSTSHLTLHLVLTLKDTCGYLPIGENQAVEDSPFYCVFFKNIAVKMIKTNKNGSKLILEPIIANVLQLKIICPSSKSLYEKAFASTSKTLFPLNTLSCFVSS